MEKIEVGEVQVERLDDIPVIFGLLQNMHIQAVIDEVIAQIRRVGHHDLAGPHSLGT